MDNKYCILLSMLMCLTYIVSSEVRILKSIEMKKTGQCIIQGNVIVKCSTRKERK